MSSNIQPLGIRQLVSRISSLLFLGTVAVMPVIAQPTTSEDVFETSFTEIFSSSDIVGASAVLLRHGVVCSRVHHGMADLERSEAVDARTIFHWASNTKLLIGVAIIQLRDHGLLALDDPATEYLPEMQKIHNPYGTMNDVTIRHLLSHTSGLQMPSWPWGGDKPWQPFEPTTWAQLVAMMPYMQIEFEPGTQFGYSNPAYNYLGKIIEVVTGDEIETYIHKNIFMPLEMNTAYFDRTPWHLRSYRSNSYEVIDEVPVAQGREFDTGATAANGGLNAGMDDIVNFVRFLMGNVTPGHDRNALSRDTLDEMIYPQIVRFDGDDIRESVGLSIFIREPKKGANKGNTFYGHTGGQHSYATFIYFSLDSSSAAIAALNTTNRDTLVSTSRSIQDYMLSTISPNINTGAGC